MVFSWYSGAAALLLCVLAAPVGAQVQNSRIPTSEAVRNEYLGVVNEDISKVTEAFRTAIRDRNVEAMMVHFTADALYSPSGGESHYGTEAIRTALGGRIARASGLALTRVDFTASGRLAYQFGRYFYGPGPDGTAAESGTYILVMYQDGNVWKIRSYVERKA